MKYEQNEDHWKTIALNSELQYHKRNKWRQTDQFYVDSLELFKKFDLTENSFKNKKILDAGCGSKLRTKVFNEAKIYALDPLANEFIKDIEWSDLKESEKIYSIPLEIFEPTLENEMDAVLCINVLDHGFEYKKQIDNLIKYLKPSAKLYLSVDINRKKKDIKHNSLLAEDILKYLSLKENFEIIWSLIDDKTFDKAANKCLNIIGEKYANHRRNWN